MSFDLQCGTELQYHIFMFEREGSACRCWIARPQIDCAMTHAVAVFEVPSRSERNRVMAFLGYTDESRKHPMEVLVSQRTRKAFHAMDCRAEWLHSFDEEQ